MAKMTELLLRFPPDLVRKIDKLRGVRTRAEVIRQMVQEGLDRIPSYDPAFQAVIGGYPKGAVVASVEEDRFWISVVDNNLTDPDDDGEGWE